MSRTPFEWDPEKDRQNQQKHGVAFVLAQYAFADAIRVILEDDEHSAEEERFYCLGQVDGGILTVCFTYRNKVIRIIGAGYWRNLDRLLHLSDQGHSYYRRRILAERKKDL